MSIKFKVQEHHGRLWVETPSAEGVDKLLRAHRLQAGDTVELIKEGPTRLTGQVRKFSGARDEQQDMVFTILGEPVDGRVPVEYDDGSKSHLNVQPMMLLSDEVIRFKTKKNQVSIIGQARRYQGIRFVVKDRVRPGYVRIHLDGGCIATVSDKWVIHHTDSVGETLKTEWKFMKLRAGDNRVRILTDHLVPSFWDEPARYWMAFDYAPSPQPPFAWWQVSRKFVPNLTARVLARTEEDARAQGVKLLRTASSMVCVEKLSS